jgi:hypothetical protein
MSVLWIRVEANEAESKRVFRLRRLLNASAVVVVGHLAVLGGKLAEQAPEGDVSEIDDEQLEEWARWEGEPGVFASAFREVCAPDGEIEAWEDTMGELLARRRADAERKRLAREKLRHERERLEAERGTSRASERTRPRTSADSPRKSRLRDETDGRDEPDGLGKTSPSEGVVSPARAREAEPPVARPSAEPPLAAPARGPLADALGHALVVPGLPAAAEQLLAVCYGDASAYPEGERKWRQRRRDVEEQLRDSLDPRRPGARLDSRTYVHAESPEQLGEAIESVLASPPRVLDAAIVFVLKRLLKLQSAAATVEARAADDAAQRQREEREGKDRRRRARAWLVAHPDERETIVAAVDAGFGIQPGQQLGDLQKRMRDEAVLAKAAQRMEELAHAAHAEPAGVSA